MARVGRPPRHSDPTPVPPSQPIASNPKHLNGLLGGWEYPLSREEKKHRVLCLYQAELEQAEKKNHASQGEKKQHSHALAHVPRSSKRNYTVAGLLVVVAGVFMLILLITTLVNEPQQGLQSGVFEESVQMGRCSEDLHARDTSSLGLPPPNISDRILGMRSEGHVRLKMSNCAEAEWWFASALALMSTSNNSSGGSHPELVGERGFSLVCAQSFEAGAKELEHHISDVGLNRTSPHLTNALGYAYFKMQEIGKAADVFEKVSKIEPLNPIVWNNLASAKMVESDLTSADTALALAVEIIEQQPHLWDWFKEVVFRNLQHFLHLTQTENLTSLAPDVEIWNGYPQAL